jgi:hypothetical protein
MQQFILSLRRFSTMKRVAPLVLLTLFLFNLCGYYFVFEFRQTENRKSMRELIHNNQEDGFTELKIPLSLITSDNSTFRQTGEDEIYYNGRMYDIASSETKGDGFVYFKCLSDSEEEGLSSDLAQNILDNSTNSFTKTSDHKPFKISLTNLIQDYLLTEKENLLSTPPTLVLFKNHSPGKSQVFLSEIPSPPPQLV